MKTFLLTVALFAAVACAAPKSKRDVSHLLKSGEYLPPNHHHHHEHHHHEAQQPQFVAPQSVINTLAPEKQSLQLPVASYGVPFNAAPAPAPAAQAPVTSYGTPVVQAPAAPQVHYAAAPAPVPHTVYGVPQQYQQHQPQYQQPQQHYQQPQQHYQQPQQQHYQPQPQYQQPQQHYQPQPQYQQPQQQHHHHQAPQPVPHQSYGVPQVHQAQAPAVHYVQAPAVHHVQAPAVHHVQAPVVNQAPVVPQYTAAAPAAPAFQQNLGERLVFDAPVPSVEVSQSHSVEHVPSTPVVSAPVPAPEHHHEAVSVESIGKTNEVHHHHNQQQVGSNGGYVY